MGFRRNKAYWAATAALAVGIALAAPADRTTTSSLGRTLWMPGARMPMSAYESPQAPLPPPR